MQKERTKDQPPHDLIRFTLDGEGLRTEMILGSQCLEQAASLFSMHGERQLIIVTDTMWGRATPTRLLLSLLKTAVLSTF